MLAAPWHAAFQLAHKALELLRVYQSGDAEAADAASRIIRRAWLATMTTAPKAYDYAVFASIITQALTQPRTDQPYLSGPAGYLQVVLWQRFGAAFLEEDVVLIDTMLCNCVATRRGRRRAGTWTVPTIAARLIFNARERAAGRAGRHPDFANLPRNIYLFMDLNDRDDEDDIAKAVATACTRAPNSNRNRK
ncbi:MULTISPECIES: hypothetical protein [Sorangium]|uniref:hypothetical protein n=1 Tax=Sorangium TaxID=39643 RepID=UPI003D9C3EE9